MKRIVTLVLFSLLLLPLSVAAEVFELRPGLKVVMPEVTAPWIVTTEPIPSLVEHIAEHIQEEAAEKGKTITMEQAAAVARQRLQNNELFVLNEESEAHLLISFEPLDEGKKAPSARAIANSVKHAIDGVTDEGWTEVSHRQAVTQIKGAQLARWFQVDYTHEDQRHLFMGIVGFADPYWFWLYANDHLRNPDDRAVLEKLMLGIEIRVEP
jgi:hypothetical protein